MSSVKVNVNSIFYKSYGVDPESNNPVYVFDSTYLPSFSLVNDKEVYELLIDGLMDKVLKKLPTEPFSLVVFSSGFTSNDISWVYVFQVLKNALRIKDLNKDTISDTVIHVPSLTALANHLDITLLRISLNVYLYDYQFNEKIDLPEQYKVDVDSLSNRQYRQLVFDRIFKRLKIEGRQSELVFQKPGSYKKINILLDVIERNHYVDLSQWDIYSLGSVFLSFLKNKTKPLIPLELIPLPLSDDLLYTKTTFHSIIKYNNYYDLLRAVFPLFIDFLENSNETKHNLKTLSKCLSASLCKEKVSIKSSDRLAIGTRFIRNLLTQFYSIIDDLDSQNAPALPARIVSGNTIVPPELPKPRKSSPTRYTITSPTLPASDLQSETQSKSASEKCTPALTETSDDSSLNSQHELITPTAVHITDIPILQPPSSSIYDSRNSSTNSLNSNKSVLRERLHSPLRQLGKDIITDAESNENDGLLGLNDLLDQLAIDNNAKIQSFDKEMKKKKLIQQKSSNTSKFSDEGYAGITKGSKVSKLAALYEERLQGLQAINDLK
ncbi:unnamed protein product [Kluyveromyces dobzhanskii CBS 2104]|uniref:WGS project CCBQ000000000 data, contig MAT n=1 Tax=Kluyveromyces dobzhanskii CBS 2104 TaxID=1427455 RepID=A0A0A8L3P8_9SACH|nr:unnamed protein product [Kluyveromyces dobzhanskii CBS 2104]